MAHKKLLLIVALLITGCNGSVGNNATNMCSATFTGGVAATSDCQLDAVYATGAMATSIAFSGVLSGSAESWDGLSFDLAGMPSTGMFDFTKLSGVGGDVSDGSGSDVWSIAGGAGVSAPVGALSFMIASAKVASTEATGSVYELHGFASARLKYSGSGSGSDVVLTIGF